MHLSCSWLVNPNCATTLLNFWCHCLGVCFKPHNDFTSLYIFFLSLGYESFWLVHIDHFFKIAAQKSSLDIDVMDEHVINRYKCKKDSDRKYPDHKRICVKKSIPFYWVKPLATICLCICRQCHRVRVSS